MGAILHTFFMVQYLVFPKERILGGAVFAYSSTPSPSFHFQLRISGMSWP